MIKLLPSLLKLDNDQINFHIIDARFVLGILIILGDSIGIIILIMVLVLSFAIFTHTVLMPDESQQWFKLGVAK